MRNDLKPWDRQPGESNPAYAAFLAYLRMNRDGGFRNLSELAKLLAKSRQLLDGWKQRWKWQQRCDEWDKTTLEQERLTLIKERQKMIKNHKAIGHALQGTALEALKEFNKKGKKGVYFKDIVAALKIGVAIEQQAADTELRIRKLELENEKLKAEGEKLRAEIRAGQEDEAGITIIDDIPEDA